MALNYENLDRLIKRIESLPEKNIDLNLFLDVENNSNCSSDQEKLLLARETIEQYREGNHCGTVACIAGYAACLAPIDKVVYGPSWGDWNTLLVSYRDTAANFLGLTLLHNQNALFGSAYFCEMVVFGSQKAIALSRLNYLKEKGDLDGGYFAQFGDLPLEEGAEIPF